MNQGTTKPASVFMGTDNNLLCEMLEFYSFPEALILDCTANKRRIWKNVTRSSAPVFMDIDPEMSPDIVGDFRKMPFPDSSFDVIVFDPPHLPHASASSGSMSQMVQSYGLGYAPTGDNVSSYFKPFLLEAERVLKPDGIIFSKLKDFVHNHNYQWTLVDWIQAVRSMPSFTPCDLRIKRDPCGGNLKSGRWKKSHHARNVHCWWVITRKGNCERKSF